MLNLVPKLLLLIVYLLSLETLVEGTALMTGGEMEIGDKLVSANRCFKLVFEQSGYLVKEIRLEK